MTLLTPVKAPKLSVQMADATLPMWQESMWVMEWFSLRTSSIYRGAGVRPGNGDPVVVVPGFMCTDHVLYEMYGWLRRIGYEPHLSGIGLNVNCPRTSAERLERTVARVHRKTGRRVRIVGHSLGGLIGRHVALERPDLVSQVVYMGSPIQMVRAHPMVVAAAVALVGTRSIISGDHCLRAGCECDFTADARRPLPSSVQHAAIYTRGDGVVDWHDAREKDPRRNHEVGGTHVGLVFNPRAYRVLGDILAERRFGGIAA
jgi:pimeloyl-ACP methyl ester carboxylesterase